MPAVPKPSPTPLLCLQLLPTRRSLHPSNSRDQLRAECVAAEWSNERVLRRMEIQKHKLLLVLRYLEGFSESTRIEERGGIHQTAARRGLRRAGTRMVRNSSCCCCGLGGFLLGAALHNALEIPSVTLTASLTIWQARLSRAFSQVIIFS